MDGWPLHRKLLSSAGSLYARSIGRIPIRDCTAGYLGLRKELVQELLDEHIDSEGYVFHIELKYIAWQKGYSIKETPIIFTDRRSGKSKISQKIIVEAFCRVMRIGLTRAPAAVRGNAAFKIIDRYAGILLLRILHMVTSKRKSLPTGYKTILVIKLSALGDTILLIPSLRSLRKQYPEARIIALGTNINQEIFSSCPYVDETIVLNIKKFLANPLAFLRDIKAKHIELALDFDQWLRLSPLLAFLSGAPVRIGFKTEGQSRHYLYSHYIEHKRDQHEVLSFLSIVGVLGNTEQDNKLEYWIKPEATTAAGNVLDSIGIAKGDKLIVFHPETPAHGKQRQWPLEKYIELGRECIKRKGIRILITGTRKDQMTNRQIARALGPSAYLMPPVPISVFAAALQRSSLLVCGNTGIMHLACALDLPVVALHGPTDPKKWGPWGTQSTVIASKLNCSPCLYLGFEYGCERNSCMNAIEVADVLSAIEKHIALSS